ncbi:MAG TPA: 3D-(3,5/4)-trihydroxycyclohexane-1,2-dione acylhydrolase (decyclizing), partial [Thermopolyspora sp.]
LPVDLAANAASLGADVLRATSPGELRVALRKAREAPRTTVIYTTTVPGAAPDSEATWDVPVAEVSAVPAAQKARERYERDKRQQLPYL